MTEAEWLAASDPGPMLEFVRSKASERKVRLFSAACCRRIWHLLTDERSKVAVEFTERRADGLATEEELQTAAEAAPSPYPPDEACDADPTHEYNTEYSVAVVTAYGITSVACAAAYAARPLTGPFRLCEPASSFMYSPIAAAEFAVDAHTSAAIADAITPLVAARQYTEACAAAEPINKTARQEERQHQCDIVRCIFSHALRDIVVDPSWLTTHVTTLAQAIYSDRGFERMPVLAAALEDAGCADADLLAHCRGEGPHVRGCWVVDLVLGKS